MRRGSNGYEWECRVTEMMRSVYGMDSKGYYLWSLELLLNIHP